MATTFPVALYVSVPVACFRVPQAREYLETSLVPPPSTVYGMLLSLVGEPNRLAHAGAEVGLGVLAEPERSTVLRTVWRVKDAAMAPGMGNNRRPDFQELLTGVELAVFVRPGGREAAAVSLAERVHGALSDPASIVRYGGLSLGESTHLVDAVRRLRSGDLAKGRLLVTDAEGDLPLPVWPDHVGSAGTRWGHFRLLDDLPQELPNGAWVTIVPPD